MSSPLYGAKITLLGQFYKLVLQLVSLVVLSRLLTPTEFGIFAVLLAILSFGELIRDFGITGTALTKVSLSSQGYSNLFWLTSVLGLSISLIVGIVAFTIFAELRPYLPVVVSIFFLNSMQSIYQVYLAHKSKYKVLVFSDMSSQSIGLVVAVVSAVNGAGVWSLVFQIVAVSVCLLATRAWASRWIPTRFRRGQGTISIARAGSMLGLAQILTYLSNNAITFLLDRLNGAETVGNYARANQMVSVPVNQILAPLSNVFLPQLARKRESGGFQQQLLKIQNTLLIPCFLLFSLLINNAQMVSSTLLGPEWDKTTPFIILLGVAAFFQALGYICYWKFLALNLSRSLLLYNLITKPLTIILTLCGAYISPHLAVMGYALGVLLSWPICLVWLNRRTEYSTFPIFKSGVFLLSVATGSLLAVSVIFSAPANTPLESLPRIIVHTTLYTVLLLLSRDTRRVLFSAFRSATSLFARHLKD